MRAAASRLRTSDSRRVRPVPALERPKATLEFYGSAAWKRLIRDIIARRGRQCEDPACKTPNRGRGKRVYGDHIVELKDGGAPLDAGNILLRCAACHSLKTHKAKQQREFAIDR